MQPGKPDKSYGAYKVSEYTHSDEKRGYRVDESSGVPARAETIKEMTERLEQSVDLDFKRKHTKGDNNQEFKKEYKTTYDALKELSPWNIKFQLQQIKSLTPEEYETIMICVEEVKTNIKLYTLGFCALSMAFTMW